MKTVAAPPRKRAPIDAEQLLALIESIQQAISAGSPFQSIVDTAGAALAALFQTGDLAIGFYDEERNLFSHPFCLEHGARLSLPTKPPPNVPGWHVLQRDHLPLLANDAAGLAAAGF